MTEPLDPEHDSTYIFNSQLRAMPYEGQRVVVDSTLDFLDSFPASMQYGPADLIYLKGVWKRIDKRVEEHADKVGRN